MTTATVSAAYLQELLDFSVSRGAERHQLLEIADIGQDNLDDPDGRLPMNNYILLMRAAKKLCADPALPLHLGSAQDFHKISVVGLLCYAAVDMAEACRNLNHYGRLVAEFDLPVKDQRFQLVPCEQGIWFIDTRNDPNSFPEMTEETWSRFIAENRRHFPDIPYCKAVHVTHAEPGHAEEYQDIMGAPVIFNSDKNALLIDSGWPDVKLHQPNSYAFGVLSEHADRLLRQLEDSKTVRGNVEALLIPRLHKGDTSMGSIAAKMGLSRQTLYRKLKAEGICYESLFDQLRHQMALNYLKGKRTSVYETAYLLGFSEPSAFHRAFKRWTGKTPGDLIDQEGAV